MKKLSILILLAALLTIAVTPVGAMIGGEIDTEHTSVGAIVFEWPTYGDILARDCTATLIHERVMVTAAHCTVPLIVNDLVPEKVWVTFEGDALMGTPQTHPDQYLEIAEIINHPDFGAGKEYNDIALVILVEPVLDRIPVKLPKEGYMDAILQDLRNGKGKRNLDLIFVGYGASEYKELPDLHLDAIRRLGTVSFVNLLPLEILANNSSSNDATICDGDSGGPVFHKASPGNEVFVGLHSREGSSSIPCDGLGPSYKSRMDTANAINFINNNLP